VCTSVREGKEGICRILLNDRSRELNKIHLISHDLVDRNEAERYYILNMFAMLQLVIPNMMAESVIVEIQFLQRIQSLEGFGRQGRYEVVLAKTKAFEVGAETMEVQDGKDIIRELEMLKV
jgi:hypothetical protein